MVNSLKNRNHKKRKSRTKNKLKKQILLDKFETTNFYRVKREVLCLVGQRATFLILHISFIQPFISKQIKLRIIFRETR